MVHAQPTEDGFSACAQSSMQWRLAGRAVIGELSQDPHLCGRKNRAKRRVELQGSHNKQNLEHGWPWKRSRPFYPHLDWSLDVCFSWAGGVTSSVLAILTGEGLGGRSRWHTASTVTMASHSCHAIVWINIICCHISLNFHSSLKNVLLLSSLYR